MTQFLFFYQTIALYIIQINILLLIYGVELKQLICMQAEQGTGYEFHN